VFINVAGMFAHNSSINSAFTKSWILDSGATDHIASDSQFFTHTSSLFNDNITLKDVLCIPSFNLNLMFVSKITNSLNCCVILFPHGCVLHDLATGRMIGSGKQYAGLYYMSPLPNQTCASQILTDHDLWHKRLRYLYPTRLQLASSLLPINKNLISIHNNFSIFPKAKQTRLHFPLSTTKSHSPFNLLYCDIQGPHKTLTHFRKHFFSL